MPMTALRKVVVVGASLAGLACALACATAGSAVTLVDPNDSPRSAGPASSYLGHLDLIPNLWRDLVSLGLAPACMREGFAYSHVEIIDSQGKRLSQIGMPALAGAHLPRAMGISGQRLLNALCGALHEAGVERLQGSPMMALGGSDTKPAVLLRDGRQVEGDLVLLATGASATIREKVFGTQTCSQNSASWLHACLPRPPRLNTSTWILGSQGFRLQMLPLSSSQLGIRVAFAGTENVPTAAFLRSLLTGHAGMPRMLAAAVQDDTPVFSRTVPQTMLPSPWHRAGVLAVGDCAHALPPYFEQGAAQAIEDALVLGELLRQQLDQSALLAQFMHKRSERARSAYALTQRGAEWMERPQTDTDFAALLTEFAAMAALPA